AGAVTITGGSAAAGGTLSVVASPAHGGFIGDYASHALLKLTVTAAGGDVVWNSLKFDVTGGLPSQTAGVQVFRNTFKPGVFTSFTDAGAAFNVQQTEQWDHAVGFGDIFPGASTGTVTLYEAQTILSGETTTYFVALDMQRYGQHPPLPDIGLSLGSSVYFGLSQGSVADQAIYPILSGDVDILKTIDAAEGGRIYTPYQPAGGGVDSGVFAEPGQQVTVLRGTGTWSPGSGFGRVPVSGVPGTEGQGTVVPGGRVGALMLRVGAEPWVAVGTGPVTVTSQFGGNVFLGMNDINGDYYNNLGLGYIDFSVSGATAGALSGQIVYLGTAAASGGQLKVIANRLFCEFCRDGVSVATVTVPLVGGQTLYNYLFPSIQPGFYNVNAYISNNVAQTGGFEKPAVNVPLSQTPVSAPTFTMSLGFGRINATLQYTGIQNQGDFFVGVTTTSDLRGEVTFFGDISTPAAGGIALQNLPTPNTFYLVSFRDVNFSHGPDGPEPLGIYGVSTNPVNLISSGVGFIPIFVDTGATVTLVTPVELIDRAAIGGNLRFQDPLTNAEAVILAGHGFFGTPGYVVENAERKFISSLPSNGSIGFDVGLLSPATNYTVFAFLDDNRNGNFDANERFGQTPSALSVSSASFAYAEVFIGGASAPPLVTGFLGTALDTTKIQWTWNPAPGATLYKLVDSVGAVVNTTAATSFLEVLGGPNTLALIRGIKANNLSGDGPTAGAPALATLAEIPATPVLSGVTAAEVTLTGFSNGNPAPATLYEINRATGTSAPFFVVRVTTATTITDTGLAPGTTYLYYLAAVNAGGVRAFNPANTASTATLQSGVPSISGSVGYLGKQSGSINVIVSTSANFFPVSAQVSLPVGSIQPYYLPVPNGTYFVRAFIDCGTPSRSCTAPLNGGLEAGEDRGHFRYSTNAAQSVVVAGGPVPNTDFTVRVDTVAPAAPAGLTLAKTIGRIDTAWIAPSKSADNGALNDLAFFRVERATAPVGTAPGVLAWTALAVTTQTVYADRSPIPDLNNLYRIIAIDLGANESTPSGLLGIVPAAGGTITGALEYRGTTLQGAFRVRLGTTTGFGFIQEVSPSTSTPYRFAGLADGTYFVRGFRDLNGDGVQDRGSDPAGTFGGIAQPYPVQIINGNSVSNSTVTICDRTPIAPGNQLGGNLDTMDCRALDQGRGWFTDIYTFPVGGGAAGSVGVGSQVEIRLESTYANRLFLLGPDGNVVASDNRPGGAVINTNVTQAGSYRIEPTSFDQGVTGAYLVKFHVVGGFAGQIGGSATYNGTKAGNLTVQVFNTADANAFPIRISTFSMSGSLATYAVTGLPDGLYYVRAYKDSNANFVKDAGEPEGAFGVSASSPTAIRIVGGVPSANPANITLTDPAVGSVAGQILRQGTQAGTIRVEIGTLRCNGCSDLNLVAFTELPGAGAYALDFIAPATSYVVQAYVDVNENNSRDPLEASQIQNPVAVTANSTTTVNLLVTDPGLGAQGNATLSGTIAYAGTQTGNIFVAIAGDPEFNSISYILTLAEPGAFSKAGILGGTTYYIASFLDVNANGQPDDHDGEPVGVLGGSFENQTGVFVSQTGSSNVGTITLVEPPTGRINGRVSLTAVPSGPVVVQAFRRACSGGGNCPDFSFSRTSLAPTAELEYNYELSFLRAATDYNVNAFIDLNGNDNPDFGEPFAQFGQTACSGTGPCFGAAVTVSSGTGSFPTYGVNIFLQNGAGFTSGGGGGDVNSVGQIGGEVIYLGTQGGPIVVRLFQGACSVTGTPLQTQSFPFPPGPTPVNFTFSGLAFGTYCVDAFRDTSNTGSLNTTFNAYGVIGTAELSQTNSFDSVYGDPITDPGKGGSVNAYTGSFSAPGGARFDGGATDLALTIRVDTITANGPFLYVMGLTKQNEGTVFSLVKYSSAGVFVASTTLANTNFPRVLVAPNGNVWVGGSIGSGGNVTSTAALFGFSPALQLQNTFLLNKADIVAGLAWLNGFLYVTLPSTDGEFVRKVDPATGVTVATGTYVFPSQGAGSDTNAHGLTVDPVNSEVYVQASSGFGDFGNLTALFKFGANLGAPLAQQDVTGLNLGDDAAIAFNPVSGNLFLASTRRGDTRSVLYKFNTGLGQVGSVSFSPIVNRFGNGLGSLAVGPDGSVFQALQAPAPGGGDFLTLRYDSSLVLQSSRTFDGFNNTLEDGAASVAVLDTNNVYVTGSVNNGQNLDWATIRQNMATSGSQSGAGQAVVITSNTATNAIIGKLVYRVWSGANTSSGTVRSVLVDGAGAPVRNSTASFAATVGYVFNNLFSGEYFLKAFIDKNNNFVPDADEPIALSEDIFYTQGSNLNRPDLPFCDRRPITAGVAISTGISTNDCKPESRSGAYEQLYTFGGSRGQAVTIDCVGAERKGDIFDTYATLRDPDGVLVATDDESGGNSNARITNYVLTTDGVWTLGCSPFAPGVVGTFRVSLSGSAGSLGSISGAITYTGSQGGGILAGIFDTADFDAAPPVQVIRAGAAGVYTFTNLQSGSTYYIGAFVDANFNQQPDPGEDTSFFGTGSPAGIFLQSGQNLTGIDFIIAGSTAVAANAAGITGQITYAGTLSGAVRVEFWGNSAFQGQPTGVRTLPFGAGPYDVSLPGGVPYYVRAFMDLDGDSFQDPNEPNGVYAPNGQGAEAVFLPTSGTVPNIDFALKDPGTREITGGFTSATGEGTATISSGTTGAIFGAQASLPAGTQSQAIDIRLVVGASGLRKGGAAALVVPPGWPFPQVDNAGLPGYFTAAVASPGGFTSPTFPNEVRISTNGGPSILVAVLGSTPIVSGSTVTFRLANLFVPCFSQTGTFNVATAQGTGSTTTLVAPTTLLNGSPTLAVAVGAAAIVTSPNPYFSIISGTLSEAQRLETRDFCGNVAPVAGNTNVTLRARTYDFNTGNFTDDSANLKFSTATTGGLASPQTVSFPAGQSSALYYALATTTGPKNVEVTYNLGAAQTFYSALTVLQGNTLSNVSVSTIPFQLGQTTCTIIPNPDPTTPNQAFINFDLSDPTQPWQILISSLPFKTGIEPTPVWQTWGSGQPPRGSVAWDGRYSPWINFGGRVPSGTYFVRVDVGGGLRDQSLIITVVSPQLAGKVVDGGTTPQVPLGGATIRAYGPFGGGTAETDAYGNFTLPGLSAGTYQLFLEKADYLYGSGSALLTASGAASTATAYSSDIRIATTSAGGLTIQMFRAPTLFVTPTLAVTESTQPYDQWGNLTVQNSTASANPQFYSLPMRLPAGTREFDDGGQWDPSTQQFVFRTQFKFNVSVDTFTINATFPGYDSATATTFVPAGATSVTLPNFQRRKSISGSVTLPFNTFGQVVSFSARPSSASVAASSGAVTSGFASTFLPPGACPGACVAQFTIGDLLGNATYFLRANAQGLQAVSTGPIFLGAADLAGINFPNFADPRTANIMVGTVTVAGNTNNFPAIGPGLPQLRVHVNAWAPNNPNLGGTFVDVATNAVQSVSSFSITGLTPGATYQIYSYLEHRGGASFTAPLGFPRLATIDPVTGKNPEGSLQYSFELASGTINGTIVLPDGSRDFGNVTLFGRIVDSARPEEIGNEFVEVSTGLPNFACTVDGSAAVGANCPVGNSSATFKVTNLDTQTLDVTFAYRTTGATRRLRVSVTNGTATVVTADLRGSTFSIAGAITNNITNSLFNTNANLVANAPLLPILDGDGKIVTVDPALSASVPTSTASLARVVAIKQDLAAGFSNVFNAATDRVGYVHVGGTWTIRNLTPGVYFVRTANLRNCATCPISVPQAGTNIRVGTVSVSGVNLTLSDGFTVSGSISLANSVQDARVFNLTVLNRRQEVIRSTTVYLGDQSAGIVANSVNYSFENLPRGDFYTLIVQGTIVPIKYVGRPIKFPDPALSPTGLQANLTNQNVTMQRAAYVTGVYKDGNTDELISDANVTVLPPNLKVTATANPWVEGGFTQMPAGISGRPMTVVGNNTSAACTVPANCTTGDSCVLLTKTTQSCAVNADCSAGQLCSAAIGVCVVGRCGTAGFLVGPLLPDVAYDIKIAQEKWDLAFLAQGSQNYTPVSVSGVKAGPGELRSLGVVTLNQGSSLKGTVTDSTGTILGNIKVLAKPTFGESSVEVQTFSGPDGRFTLWVSTFIASQFDITAAPRGGNTASNGKVYQTQARTAVNLVGLSTSSQITVDFKLTELLGSVTGQVRTIDGAELSYPFGEQKGFPAAALFLQPRGVPAIKNPLGDIEAQTNETGAFEVVGLSTGSYSLRAVSLGYVIAQATVSVRVSSGAASFCIFQDPLATNGCLQTIVLSTGAVVTGRITKPDPTTSSGFSTPNADEVDVVAAATPDFSEFVIGSVEIDPNARTVNSYTISGFRSNTSYDIIIAPKDSDELVFPPEGAAVTFTSTETTKTINLTYNPAAPVCVATTYKTVGNNQYQVKILCSKAFRNKVAADNDLDAILSLSTATSAGQSLAGIAPAGVNGTGTLLGGDKKISNDRRTITAIYRAQATETQFAIRIKGVTEQKDPTSGAEYAIDQTFDLFTGITAKKEEQISNVSGGKLNLETSDADLALGKDEKGSVEIEAGTFESTGTANASKLNVKVGMQKADDVKSASAKFLAKYGYVPSSVYRSAQVGAIPMTLFNAMEAYKTQASSGVTAASAFYDVFLPLGIKTQLKKPAVITLSFDPGSVDSTKGAQSLDVYFYNPATQKFELESGNKKVDETNKTISVTVSHFSVFVVLAAPPVATIAGFSGDEIRVWNFPNPFDCVTKTVAIDPSLGALVNGNIQGTMIHIGLPAGAASQLTTDIYNVAGELVSKLDSGQVAGGNHVYVPWNCHNTGGRNVASGVYFGNVKWGGKSKFFKMAVIKGSRL
ncbi:MAG: carboxypeptidase regulatory-like domain-containing protein, partial [Elusimicrobia bacterium]|nr:carboxypeptidase regulatory-like domain-containing protein [Elusimicrobiota bacterium]